MPRRATRLLPKPRSRSSSRTPPRSIGRSCSPARARPAKDLGVNVPELGAQSESDINGQISILENAVAGKPAAVVISPTEFKALGKPVDEAAKKVPIIGINSAADSKAFTSFLTTDNVQGGRIAADGLAEAITAKYGKAEGEVALITSLPGVGSLEARAKGFKEELAANIPASSWSPTSSPTARPRPASTS